jgi:hypothetical protein
MLKETTQHLLKRIDRAIDSRPIPALEQTIADDDDWEHLIKQVQCVWREGPAPPIVSDTDFIALVWFTPAQFRVAFLRLIESALRHPETEIDGFLIATAAEPVPRGSLTPPARFSDFSAEDIQLVSDCLPALNWRTEHEAKLPVPWLREARNRIVDRALRNWARFTAHVEWQSAAK